MRRAAALALAVVVASCSAGRPAVRPRAVETPPTTTSISISTTTTVGRTTTSTTVARPPFAVTVRTIVFVDASRPTISRGHLLATSRTLPTEVWLPRRPGPLPLVVFASGFDVGPSTYTALLSSWAAAGFAVAAPEFPLEDPERAGSWLDEADLQNEPGDVRFVTAGLLTALPVDPSMVAVAGHSDGAEAALAAATSGPPAYRCLLVLSGQPVPGGAGRNPPVLVTQGDADTINPPSFGLAVFEQARPPRYLLVIEGGGHLPPLQPGSRWFPGVVAVTLAFLDAYDGSGPASAIPAAARYPGLSLRSG